MAPEQSNFNDVSPQAPNDGAGSVQAIDLKADVLEAAAPLMDSVTKAIDEQKEAGADRLKSFANAITSAAPGFEEQMPQLAASIRDAGAWMERSAADVRDQKFEELVETVGNFARDKPVLAFGVAALSGFALSRFLKSNGSTQSGTPANSSTISN